MKLDLIDKAFLLLRRNYGCPGIDGIPLREIKRDYEKHRSLLLEKYDSDQINTLPIKKTTIIDYNGKDRDIFVYCVYERWLQMYLKLQIEPGIESKLKNYVFGYRKSLTMKDLRQQLVDTGLAHILHLDIAKYFDRIDRELLFDYLEHTFNIDIGILFKIRKSVSHTSRGLPQGNVLSPILSNIYLLPFDEIFPEQFARFSDDLYFALDKPKDKDAIIAKVNEYLQKLGLKLNYSKLEIKNVDQL